MNCTFDLDVLDADRAFLGVLGVVFCRGVLRPKTEAEIGTFFVCFLDLHRVASSCRKQDLPRMWKAKDAFSVFLCVLGLLSFGLCHTTCQWSSGFPPSSFLLLLTNHSNPTNRQSSRCPDPVARREERFLVPL